MSSKKRVLPNTVAVKKKDLGMTKTYKFIGLVTAVCVVLAGLAIAGILVANSIAAGPKPGFYQGGKDRVKDADPFLTISGVSVTYNEYRYHYLSVKALAAGSNGGDEYWLDDPQGVKAAQIKTDTETRLRQWYAILQYAQENGIALTKDEQSGIENKLRTVREQQGDQLGAWLRERHLADVETYKTIETQSEIAGKVGTSMLENIKKEKEDDWQDGVLSAQHVLIQIAKTATDEEWEEGLKKAQEITDKARSASAAGRDAAFKLLRVESDTDTGQPEEGYTFGYGKMVDEFYDAAKELEVGEVSDPVKTDFGYHIIMRLELDTEAMEKDKENIQEIYFARLQNDEVEKRQEALVLLGGKYYGEVSPETVK